MRSGLRLYPTLLAAALLAASAAAQTRSPRLSEVMKRVGSYVESYGRQMSVIVGTERYVQWSEGPKAEAVPVTRQLVSEFALMRVEDDWIGFRDVHEVDGKPVGERQDRLRSLFLDSPANALAQLRRIADESARYNIGRVQRNINTPTMALTFVQGSHQARSKFRKENEGLLNTQSVWVIAYEEKQVPTIVRAPGGESRPATGTIWVDPAEGRVFRTHVEIVTELKQAGRRVRSTSSVTVDYGYDDRLGLLVPREMRESYVAPSVSGNADSSSGREELTRIGCRATYSDYRRFETSGRVVIPK